MQRVFFSYFEDSVHSLIVSEKEHYIAHLCPIWMNSSKNYYDLFNTLAIKIFLLNVRHVLTTWVKCLKTSEKEFPKIITGDK